MTILRATNDDGVKYDLDIFEGDDFKLDISAIESGDIGKVFGVSSQTFSLPPTKDNNEFFGNTFDVGATPAVSFTKTVDCQVLQDGSEVFTGKLYLQDVITDNQGNIVYNVVVVNETVDFKFLIQDLTFGDLDFSALDHTYNYGNITSSWDGGLEDGAIFYPLINYGFDEDNPSDTQISGTGKARTFSNSNSPIRVDDFKPAIRLRDCLDAIFDKVNYEYTSSLFTSGSYTDDIYMLATKDDKKGISDINPISQSFLAVNAAQQDFTDTQARTQVNFATAVVNNAGQYDTTTSTFTADVQGNYQFKVQFDYEILNTVAADANFVTIVVNKNGSELDKYNFNLQGSTQGLLNIVTQGYSLDVSDEITILTFLRNTVSGVQTLRVKATSSSRFELVQGPTTGVGGQTDIAENYSNINVREFLDGIIQKFNLVIEPDYNQRNVLKIETFNDWKNDGETKDWHKKVDYSQKWKITHPIQTQAKNIKFADPIDDISLTQYHKRTFGKDYGEFDYKSSSDISEGEQTIGTLFAPTPIKGIEGAPSTILPTLATKESAEPYQRYAFAPRLFFRLGRQDVNGFGKYYFEDENGTVNEETDYGLAHHLQAIPADFDGTLDLHFGNSVSPGHWPYAQNQFDSRTKRTAFTEYWAFYINELYDVDARLVTCNIFLTPEDIQTLSLNDRIHIDGHYYRINKINGANVSREDSVEVELIKEQARKSYFPRRRFRDPVDLTNVDLTLDYDLLSTAGTGSYVVYDTGLPYTGSSDPVFKAAGLDQVSVYDDVVVWATQKPVTAKFTSQTNLGLNRVDVSADIIDVRGDNNIIANNVTNARVEGANNTVEFSATNVTVTGTGNTILTQVENSTIQNSNASSIEDSELATIISGDDTNITGSNKSIAIGQDLTVQGGNSNIVIGNFDNQNKEVKDLINVTAININKSIDSADDYENGLAYMGSTHHLGAKFADNQIITVSNGDTIYLTGSEYAHDYYTHFIWSGGSGTANVYLPDTNPANFTGGKARDSRGYKRELRFFGDENLASNTKIRLYGSGSDTVDSTTSPSFVELKKAFDAVTLYAYESGSWIVTQAKA